MPYKNQHTHIASNAKGIQRAQYLSNGFGRLDWHGGLLDNNLAGGGDRGDEASSPLPVSQVSSAASADAAGLCGRVDTAERWKI